MQFHMTAIGEAIATVFRLADFMLGHPSGGSYSWVARPLVRAKHRPLGIALKLPIT